MHFTVFKGEDFSKPKIVYIEIMTDNEKEGHPFPSFSFDEHNSVVLNSGYVMTSDTVNVKYILGILNSKIGRYIAKQYVSQLQTRQFRMLSQFVNKFPIAKATNQQTSEVITMIESILEAKGDSKNINKYQQLINKETYEIYGLTKREIEFLENQSTE